MASERVVIATRQSKLALWQANFVAARLREAHPSLAVELLGMTTQGDRWLAAPLAQVGGKGLFIKELENAIAQGRADIAVHSAKDVPAALPAGFAMPLMGFRDDVRDALVSASGAGLAALPAHGFHIVVGGCIEMAMNINERHGDFLHPGLRCHS